MEESRYTLGCDPGLNGASCLLENRKPAQLLCWKPDTSKGFYEVTVYEWFSEKMMVSVTNSSLRRLGAGLPRLTHFAMEGLFVGKARQRIIGTAEVAGELMGAILANQDVVCQRPLASTWRSELLKLPPCTASVADRYARKVVMGMFGNDWEKLPGHAIDACCIALWADGLRGSR